MNNMLMPLVWAHCPQDVIRLLFEKWHMGAINPFFRTFPPLRICRGGFLFFASLVASIPDKYNLAKLAENMPKPNYEPARLVNGDKPMDARWYIVFRAWDANLQKLVRKRDYSVNKVKTLGARREYARKRIAQINLLLEAGYHVNPKLKKSQDIKLTVESKTDFTIEQAIKFILPIVQKTKRRDTYVNYSSVSGMFLKFCHAAGWDQWKIKTLSKDDIVSWLDHIQVENSLTNTGRNNYKCHLSAVFTLLKQRGALDENPVFGIKSELEDEPKNNTAFTHEQIEILKPLIQQKNPRLWLFVTFILYGFIRPKEISRLRVHMVKLDINEIHLPGSITKNRKNKRVRIGKYFRAYIDQLNLPACNQNDFIFGFNLEAGTRSLQNNYASSTHRQVLDNAGYSKEYGLYSWKPTGVILHFRAGIDIKTIQEQIGHQSLEETDIYLRSLGLYQNTEIEDKSPAI